MIYYRNCKNPDCRNRFKTSNYKQEYCSISCRSDFWKKSISAIRKNIKRPIKCPECGRYFLGKSGQKYCGEHCKHNYVMRLKMLTQCHRCKYHIRQGPIVCDYYDMTGKTRLPDEYFPCKEFEERKGGKK